MKVRKDTVTFVKKDSCHISSRRLMRNGKSAVLNRISANEKIWHTMKQTMNISAMEENTFALWRTLPVERAIIWEENAKLTFSDGESFTGGLYVEYYEAKNEWIATRLAKTLYARDRASWNVERIDLPELGLDFARGTDRVFNTVILRQGNRVLRGYFYNTALRAIPWEDWLHATAEALKTP